MMQNSLFYWANPPGLTIMVYTQPSIYEPGDKIVSRVG